MAPHFFWQWMAKWGKNPVSPVDKPTPNHVLISWHDVLSSDHQDHHQLGVITHWARFYPNPWHCWQCQPWKIVAISQLVLIEAAVCCRQHMTTLLCVFFNLGISFIPPATAFRGLEKSEKLIEFTSFALQWASQHRYRPDRNEFQAWLQPGQGHATHRIHVWYIY